MDRNGFSRFIINWMQEYLATTPLNGFVLGLSGGVDSALVAQLAARTGKEVLLLNMPIHQHSSEFSRAEKQINAIKSNFNNVQSLKIDLSSVFDELYKQMPESTQKDELSMANVRARLRMTTLYAVGQTRGLLVTGTGNKIEDFGIGFFTKYGDGGVDINPIGDLMKSEVYQLAEHLDVIPEILDAKPTDGLWGDDRSDEDQIGATYDELEWAMTYDGVGENLSSRQQEVLEIYRKLNKINQHKFHPIPICDLSSLRK